jgi:hypothetical protein
VARITVSGGSDLKAKLDRLAGRMQTRLEQAVRDEADAVAADARARVRVDEGDLQGSIAAEVDGLSATVAPRSELSSDSEKQHAIKAAVNEFGRSRDPGQPYMVPSAEQSRQRWPQRAADAGRDAAKG